VCEVPIWRGGVIRPERTQRSAATRTTLELETHFVSSLCDPQAPVHILLRVSNQPPDGCLVVAVLLALHDHLHRGQYPSTGRSSGSYLLHTVYKLIAPRFGKVFFSEEVPSTIPLLAGLVFVLIGYLVRDIILQGKDKAR
jgi:hypothetical protein